MDIHLLSGFLGSGKTTAIQHAAVSLLRQGISVGVITNDQGMKLVDGDFFKSKSIPGRQVTNGCFCCNYNKLEASISSLTESNHTQVIFAESVGSCTDIVATVLKPLLRSAPDTHITISVFADARLLGMVLRGEHNSFDEAVIYIYLKQLDEAGIIVVNKIDLISNGQLRDLTQLMHEKYHCKTLLFQNSLDEIDVNKWLEVLRNYKSAATLHSLSIDYDVYADGEAKLAWLDQHLEIFSINNHAQEHAAHLINTIYQKITERGLVIAHAKFLVNGSTKISFTSTTQPAVRLRTEWARSAELLINLRVQTEPNVIKQLIADAINELEHKEGCNIVVTSLAAFKPGYPTPTHRIGNNE